MEPPDAATRPTCPSNPRSAFDSIAFHVRDGKWFAPARRAVVRCDAEFDGVLFQSRTDGWFDQLEYDCGARFDQSSIPRVIRCLPSMEQVAPNLIDATDYFREIIPISDSPGGVPVELPDTALTEHVNGTDVIGIGADQFAV